jgi:ferric-dicitrate binding protein FerR (iron transport regulator)
MPTERVQYLVQQYFDNACTTEEMEELAAWINASGNDEPLKELLENAWHQHRPNADMPEAMSQRLLTALFAASAPKPAPVRLLRWAGAAAAAVLIIIAGWWLLQKEDKPALTVAQNSPIVPGSNGAVLTLADGRTVVLDSLKNGVFTTQGNTALKIENGQLVYDASNNAGPVAFNTVNTPKGRQFQLVLPDGSKVWLNAASGITYPTAFTGTERKVSITGEAYFEVTKNPAQPFKVSIDENNTVEVIGTHFNINAYKDEGYITTTLLEGKVKLAQTILQPGEQAIVTSDASITINHSSDLEQVMAWKNGIFYFRNAGLELVMKQLERWYNIEVQYKGKIPAYKINGKMDRGLRLQEVLDFLEKMEVKYKLNGRTITIQGI